MLGEWILLKFLISNSSIFSSQIFFFSFSVFHSVNYSLESYFWCNSIGEVDDSIALNILLELSLFSLY